MANRAGRLAVLVVAGAMLAVPRDAGAQATKVRERHLRSRSAAVLEIVDQMTDGSETFRNMLAIIEASNGLVYVEEGPCQYGVRACLVAVTPAGTDNRIIHVRVDAGRRDADLVRSIGHELYHATEVLSNPFVTTNASMIAMYRRIGRVSSGVFETEGAIDAGNAVRREFAKSMAQASRAK